MTVDVVALITEVVVMVAVVLETVVLEAVVLEAVVLEEAVLVAVLVVVALLTTIAWKVTIVPSQLSPSVSTVVIVRSARTQNCLCESEIAPEELSSSQTELVGRPVVASRYAASDGAGGEEPTYSTPYNRVPLPVVKVAALA